jgi:hypothetical protein
VYCKEERKKEAGSLGTGVAIVVDFARPSAVCAGDFRKEDGKAGGSWVTVEAV